MAEAYHVPCILHRTMGLRLAGWLQATLAIGATWQEVAPVTPPMIPQQQLAPGLKVLRSKEMYRIENGELVASDLPGLGLDIVPEPLAEYRSRDLAGAPVRSSSDLRAKIRQAGPAGPAQGN